MAYEHSPVYDLDGEENYLKDLMAASGALNRLLEKKDRVYLHCTAGQSRNTTLVLCYLCLYVKTSLYMRPEKLQSHLKEMYPGCSPNMDIVKKFLIRHAKLQKLIIIHNRAEGRN